MGDRAQRREAFGAGGGAAGGARRDRGRYRLEHRTPPRAIPSNPRATAIAFSHAGPGLDAPQPIHRDSGKRYELVQDDGNVVIHRPDGHPVGDRNQPIGDPSHG
jgi:hypothetical protein